MSKEPELVLQNRIAQFETVRGSVRILSIVYELPDTDSAARIFKAKAEAEYRAEQLEPPKPKQRRERPVRVNHDDGHWSTDDIVEKF